MAHLNYTDNLLFFFFFNNQNYFFFFCANNRIRDSLDSFLNEDIEEGANI